MRSIKIYNFRETFIKLNKLNKEKPYLALIMEKRNKKKELYLAINQFFKIVYIDFGIEKFNNKLKNWYKLTWQEFKKELEKQHVSFNNDGLLADWEEFFGKHKQKVLSLMN